MFRPASMQRVVLVAPRADLDRVLEAVARLGALHLLDLPGNGDWRSGLQPWDVGERRGAGGG
jgi:vacuolar-type H+-ATPase subunit I/STV1